MVVRKRTPEEREQLAKSGDEIVGLAESVSAKGTSGHRIGARGASDAEIDTTRMDRFKHAELFGNGQRCVVGKHHTARSEPNA